MIKEDILLMQIKPKLREYLTAIAVPYWPPSLTLCPHCGAQAGIDTLIRWTCTVCCQTGDIVDYAQIFEQLDSRSEALRRVCRVLKIQGAGFSAISAQDLMDIQFSENHILIDRFLHQGVYLLAGTHKIGKSWLVLQLAHQVSLGQPLWDFDTHKTAVLYMGLEDSYQRIQQRISHISQGDTGNITFCIDVNPLGCGFEISLTDYLRNNPHVKLVIIDTLQKIRSSGNGQYSYSKDYDAITPLKVIADRFGITILLVHHTRKMESDDPFAMISGTTGLTGAVDGSMVLLRPDRRKAEAILHITGRDIEDMAFHLLFDPETRIWQFGGFVCTEKEEKENPIIDAIVAFVHTAAEYHGTSSNLMDILKGQGVQIKSASALTRVLNPQASYLLQKYGLIYRCERTAKERIIHITPDCSAEFNDDNNDANDGNDGKINGINPLPSGDTLN